MDKNAELTKRCGTCREEKPLSAFYVNTGKAHNRHSVCKICCRPKDRRARDRFPVRYMARAKVNNAIASKRLIKQPCEVCQSFDVHAHHDDYTKPLEVRWLCRTHHEEWHKHNTPIGGEPNDGGAQ